MQLFSLIFLFCFLPLAMGIYYLTPNKHKPLILLLISVVYYITTESSNILLIAVSVLIDYILGIQIYAFRKKKRVSFALTFCGIAKNLWLFIYFNISLASGIKPPFGVFVVSLLGISYLADIAKGDLKPERNIILFGVYQLFFPKLYYGPFLQYRDIKYQLQDIKPSLTGISKGIVIFISALAKKVIIADNIVALYLQLSQINRLEYSVVTSWALLISFAFSLYFTLSAYYDMAVAVGYMFGIKLPHSFHYPFQARSLDEFFARFNITINEFVRKYVYVSLGEKSGGGISASLNMLLVCMLISLWYGINANNLVWGIYLAIFIILEQYVFGRFLKFIPIFLSRIITFIITMMSFAIPVGKSLGESLFFIRTMFGFGTDLIVDTNTLYILSSNIVLIPLCFILCTSTYYMLCRSFSKKYPFIYEGVSIVINIGLMLITIAFML